MPKRESAPIERVHVWAFCDDIALLREVYGGRLPIAKAIRSILHAFCNELRAKLQADNDAGPQIQVNLQELMKQDDLRATS